MQRMRRCTNLQYQVALPPSALTKLLYATDDSPECAFGILDRFGCLSAQALASADEVKACLEKAAFDHGALFDRLGPGAVGPSLPDALVGALRKSALLSIKGISWSEGSFWSRTPESSANEGMSFWRVDCLSLALPREFNLAVQPSGSDEGAGFQELRTWKGVGGRTIKLSVGQPQSAEPLDAVGKWRESVAGTTVSVVETASPMGSPHRTFVTQFCFQSPKGVARLSGEGVTREEFGALLNDIELRGNKIGSKREAENGNKSKDR